MRRLTWITLLLLAPLALAQEVAGLTWKVPAGWKSQAQRPMRVATYEIPAAKGDKEPAELGVFYFGKGQGGSVDANVARWIGQFKQPDGAPSDKVARRTQTKIAGLTVSQVELTGTFASGGMMMGPAVDKPNHALLGAIVEGHEGPVFFKLTGPKKTVAAAKKDFQALLQSLKVR